MKRLFLVALLIVGMTSFAQDKVKSEKLTPEQRNELQLKKLVLNLDLNENQQKEMAKIIEEQSAKREAMKAERMQNKDKNVKMTADERFAKQKAILDQRIATKERVKKILSVAQFEKWEKMNEEKRHAMSERMGEHKNKGAKKQDITK